MSICDKSDSKLSFLHRYSAFLDFRTRKLLCESLVFSCLTYCASAWYSGVSQRLKNRLEVIQRKMVRFVNGWEPRSHVGLPEIIAVGWLFFPKRVSFFKLCHLFKIKTGKVPQYLAQDFRTTSSVHSYSTRGSDLNYVPNCQEFSNNTFHYTVIREWNELPANVKSQLSLLRFKKELKRHFLNQ